ncbi:MAG: hypothetical protein HRU38_13330 [Saccharospirillaceae bacterium]|nr:hypothetical protein [Pseudomonadales bacterium]NRB79626.1 hypothetical protein [Saccharospirillaceae bacterium]
MNKEQNKLLDFFVKVAHGDKQISQTLQKVNLIRTDQSPWLIFSQAQLHKLTLPNLNQNQFQKILYNSSINLLLAEQGLTVVLVKLEDCVINDKGSKSKIVNNLYQLQALDK